MDCIKPCVKRHGNTIPDARALLSLFESTNSEHLTLRVKVGVPGVNKPTRAGGGSWNRLYSPGAPLRASARAPELRVSAPPPCHFNTFSFFLFLLQLLCVLASRSDVETKRNKSEHKEEPKQRQVRTRREMVMFLLHDSE